MSGAFRFRALDADGRLVEGRTEARSPTEAMAELERRGLTPIAVEPAAAEGGGLTRLLTPEPRPEDITALTADLAMLVEGGVTLAEALTILIETERRRWLVRLLGDLRTAVTAGQSFAEALAAHPRLFPPIYLRTVEMAETTGRLSSALGDLAAERRRADRLRRRFLSALAYPAFLVVAATGVLAFVLIYVIPQFQGALAGYEDKLAPATRRMFALSRLLRDNLDLAGGGLAVLLVLALAAGRLGLWRTLALPLLARLPVTGRAIADDRTLSFCRTLAILARNGVDISTALRLIGAMMRTPAAAADVERVTAEVRQGRRLSDALAGGHLLPAPVVRMLRVGEETGRIADSAERIAGFYEVRLESTLNRLAAVVGPALMIAVSLMVAWLIVTVMTALISVNDLVA